ncbi:histidinol dehydrogenase [Solirubrobacter sp. CPCC 204708]|uniref:Histidinol dehydrogenase n=1 Tax=Solirubrobacter deserti TaxID=2282478 RepID=A0ABT4RD59_9ACTN|nr:histidinol dehydrogenase [Solirubrobacter deserti]MBE2315645.1 histidinol dehydrogenase [Solirubrobacter deserti]MDA0136285.1 histidinol dehydrogenase [Solirubrobacter deserti]
MITRRLLDDEELLFLKRPEAGREEEDAAVAIRVSEMLLDLECDGERALRRYARELDGWDGAAFELTREEIAAAEHQVDERVREHLQRSRERVETFALAQRGTLTDLELEVAPGVVAGHRLVPVGRVGAYLPAGRFPLLASAFMTVLVPKVAGVDTVVACAPPQRGGTVHPSVVYAASLSGADRIFAIGGVQALAAMAFGLGGMDPVDMVVGAGNAYVAEAKRQLYGRVGIDLLAGPSEIAIIADDSAEPELVAADLLGQAEHGPTSPVALVTTSEDLGRAVRAEVARQLEDLATAEVAGAAWRDRGAIIVAPDRETAAAVSDELAPEHLEVQTGDDAWFHARLRNYGSIFLGARATVAFSDKGATGTNHVLPTGHAARYTGGLSVARFLKPLTYQRIDHDGAQASIAQAVVAISAEEGLAAHGATAAKRLARVAS